MSKKDIDVFDDANAIKPRWMGFNVAGEDRIFGTLVDKKQMKSKMKGKEGKMEWKYEIKADYGTTHECDELKQPIPTPITIEKGDYWMVGKDSIDAQMKNIALGTKVGLKLVEIVPAQTKGFNPAKIVKVFVPKNDDGTPQMDKEWIAEKEKEAALMAEFSE